MYCSRSKILVIFAFFILFLVCHVSSAINNAVELNEPADVVKLFKEQGAEALQFPLPRTCSWCISLEEKTLNYAVETNEIKVVEMLFAKKVITDAKKQCREAVRLACGFARAEILKILIANGADVDNASYLSNPVMDAIREDNRDDHREIVKILLAAGANVDVRDHNGRDTLLIKATTKGWADVVAMILDRNVDVNAVDSSGNTAMIYIGGDEATAVKILEMLFSYGADANIGNSPLQGAVFYPGYYGVVKILLDHFAIVNVRDSEGATSLMKAVLMGRKEIVKMLINKGADVNLKDKRGVTALMYSPRANDPEIINMLFDQGANINEVTYDGSTALICAAYYEYPDVVKLFLDRGAKIDHVNNNGKSALMYAAEYGNSKVLKVLLDRGAKKNLKDWAGQTALDMAQQKGHKDCVDILESYLQKEQETIPAETQNQNIFNTAQRIEDSLIFKPIFVAQEDVAKLVKTGRIDCGIESDIVKRLVYTRGHAISVFTSGNDAEIVLFLRLVVAGNYDDEIKNKAKNVALIAYRTGVASLSSEERDQISAIIFYLIYKGAKDILAAGSTNVQPEVYRDYQGKLKHEL